MEKVLRVGVAFGVFVTSVYAFSRVEAIIAGLMTLTLYGLYRHIAGVNGTKNP